MKPSVNNRDRCVPLASANAAAPAVKSRADDSITARATLDGSGVAATGANDTPRKASFAGAVAMVVPSTPEMQPPTKWQRLCHQNPAASNRRSLARRRSRHRYR